MRSRAWVDDALCARMRLDLADRTFFGQEHGKGYRYPPDALARARAICDACPVLFECLDDVLAVPAAHDRDGIRAGLLPSERATLRDVAPSSSHAEAAFWLGGTGLTGRRPPR